MVRSSSALFLLLVTLAGAARARVEARPATVAAGPGAARAAQAVDGGAARGRKGRKGNAKKRWSRPASSRPTG